MTRIFGCMLGLCLLLGGSGALAAQTAEATLARAMAALPAGWSVRYAALAPQADGSLTLTNVVLSHDGKLLLAAASVTIVGLRGEGSAAAPFVADQVTASALADTTVAGATTAETLVATGVSVGPGDASGLPPGSQAAAIVQALTAVRVDHAELTRLRDKDDTVGRMTLDRLAQGRVAAAAITDGAFANGAGNEHSAVAAIEANDVDIARLVRVFDPSAYAPAVAGQDAPARLAIGPAVGRFALHGLSVTKADSPLTIGAVEVTDLRLGQAPEPPEGKTFGTIPAALGGAVVGGVHFQSPAAHDPNIDLASIALTNYRDGRFDTLTLGATAFATPAEHTAFGFQSALVRGFDASAMMAWAASDHPGDAAGFPPPPRLGGFELTGLFMDTPSGDHVTAAALRDTMSYQDEAPVLQELTVSRLTVPAHGLARLVPPNALAAFGQDHVTADLDFKLVWDPRTHDLALAPFRLAAEDLGTLTLNVTMGNVDLSLLPKGPMAAMAGMVVATVKSGSLVYDDHSLIERGIAVYAAMAGQPPDALRQMLVGMLTNMKSPLPSRPMLPSQLAGFIQHPGTLTVRIAPEPAVPAAMLAALSPDETAQKLALDVTTK
jgi:hypothetical protein